MDAAAFSLLLILATTTCSPVYAQQTSIGCIPKERDALLSFRASITRDPENLLVSWNGQDCCQWSGVKCSNRTGHVIKVDLRNKFFLDDLYGPPQDTYYPHGMRGKISSSLLDLHHLKYLDLSGNRLGEVGVPIPRFLGSIRSLTYLNLSSMDFDGPVPPQLGNLSRLHYLDINSNWNEGDMIIHSEDISWLTRLPSIKFLDLSGVNLSTIVDWVQVINMLPNLRVLLLGNCQLFFPYAPIARSNLTSLEIVDLGDNRFNTLNPAYWFWHVGNIKHLDLTNNYIIGTLPDAVGNMTSLEELGLGGNELNEVRAKPLKNLCNLRVLTLWSNLINQDLSEFLKELPPCARGKLEILDLSVTNVSGEIPNWINQWTNLSIVQLSANKLVGSIPLEIGLLSKLSKLYLDYNQLTGSISEEHLTNLENLEELDLSYNSMHMTVRSNWLPPFKLRLAYFPRCKMGPHFPSWLKWQKDINYLDISGASIVDYLPDWFWTVFSNIQYLNISCNQISGRLPRTLEFMPSALIFDLNTNNLTGILPQLPRHLAELDISKNSLSGPLPRKFGGPILTDLLLSENNINGTIPAYICQLQILDVLDLAKNRLEGNLPLCLNGSKATQNHYTSISALMLYSNKLSGEFPLFLLTCPELILLDLAHNKFVGELPIWIANKLPQLSYLRLRNNTFSGSIPVQLTDLQHLQLLDLAYNRISNSIPYSLSHLKAMTQDPLQTLGDPLAWSYERPSNPDIYETSKYDDSLEVVMKGHYLDYTSNIIYMVGIDLSHNNLVGEIPDEITYLAGLKLLNISHNQLSGKIPEQIGLLGSLESLDLSWNELSGVIPSSLSDITTLSMLNLSYNNLSGTIPSGNQLQTLTNPAFSYIGNNYLCGPPTSRNCSGPLVTRSPLDEQESDPEVRYFYLAMAIGFLVATWAIFVTLLFARRWRAAYFKIIDKIVCSIEICLPSNFKGAKVVWNCG